VVTADWAAESWNQSLSLSSLLYIIYAHYFVSLTLPCHSRGSSQCDIIMKPIPILSSLLYILYAHHFVSLTLPCHSRGSSQCDVVLKPIPILSSLLYILYAHHVVSLTLPCHSRGSSQWDVSESCRGGSSSESESHRVSVCSLSNRMRVEVNTFNLGKETTATVFWKAEQNTQINICTCSHKIDLIKSVLRYARAWNKQIDGLLPLEAQSKIQDVAKPFQF
jgi:hypothetical protein